MAGLIVFSILMVGAFVPFVLVCWLMVTGKNGWALTVCTLVATLLVLLVYAASRPVGLDPLFAMSWAMLFALPGVMGSLSGALLGWLMRRRADKRGSS